MGKALSPAAGAALVELASRGGEAPDMFGDAVRDELAQQGLIEVVTTGAPDTILVLTTGGRDRARALVGQPAHGDRRWWPDLAAAICGVLALVFWWAGLVWPAGIAVGVGAAFVLYAVLTPDRRT